MVLSQGNSDNVPVTEKAIKTYVDTQLGGGENNPVVNELAVANIPTCYKPKLFNRCWRH